MTMAFRYSDTEIKKILSTLTILIDTREQDQSVAEYLKGKNVPYRSIKLDCGDYSALIPANAEMGILRDLWLNVAIERKSGIDEMANTIKDEARWEHELVRSRKLDHFMVIINDDYKNLVTGNYRSKYTSKALEGRIRSYEARFGYTTVFVPDKDLIGHYILNELYYKARAELKKVG